MSGDSRWKGHRLGPYEIGERCPDDPEDEGRLYAAHHTGTGEAALVVMPGPDDDWHRATPWRAQATRFTQPEALVVHPRSPAGATPPTLHELTLGFIRIAGALAQLDTREGARNPFTRARPRRRAWHDKRRWGLMGSGLALTAAVALLFSSQAADPLKTGDASTERMALTAGKELTAPVIAYAMPEKPIKGQRKPPCLPEAEVEIRGGCWNELARTAPCARGTAEYQGKCYVPVGKPDPEPTSILP